MAARIFLAMVGSVYLALATWCSMAQERTAKAVGFELTGGSGQSEFLVVYGGLELALGVAFVMPLLRKKMDPRPALQLCTLVHGCLVAFRSVSFSLFVEIGSTTYLLAGGEWLLFLASAFLLRRREPAGRDFQ